MTKRPRHESGYSMVEVIVAIVILTITIIPMVTMFDTGLRSATTSGNYDKARALANANLERIKAGEFPSSEATGDPCEEPPDKGDFNTCMIEKTYVYLDTSEDPATFKPGDSEDNMMRVKVTVEWSGGDNSYSATGLVAK